MSANDVSRVVSFGLLTTLSVRVIWEWRESRANLDFKFLLVIYIFCERLYSPDVHPFYFVSTLNHNCSIRMDCCNEPRPVMPPGLSIAEDTFFPY